MYTVPRRPNVIVAVKIKNLSFSVFPIESFSSQDIVRVQMYRWHVRTSNAVHRVDVISFLQNTNVSFPIYGKIKVMLLNFMLSALPIE